MSPRRTTAALAAAAVLFIGSLGFAASASASDEVGPGIVSGSIELHNATAGQGSDCPDDGYAYWHFVLAPNDGSARFVSIVVRLDGDSVTFDVPDDVVLNHGQLDNLFVGVPAGHTLDSLGLEGSYATYTGTAVPTHFNLSHVCEGNIPTTTTTTTTTEATTTTTAEVLGTTTINTAGTDDTAEVMGATEVASDTLPYTGSETVPLLVVGLLVSGIGLGLATIARRREA